MKLSMQYLQKAINNDQSNIKELTANVANTLIEQIDHLSKIAADFSQFANIGIKKVELVDCTKLLIRSPIYTTQIRRWRSPGIKYQEVLF